MAASRRLRFAPGQPDAMITMALPQSSTLAARRDRLLLAGIALLAFVLRVWRLDYQSLWRDEVDAVLFASRSLPDALAMFTRVGENGPLYFLGLNVWIDLAGQSELAIRFPSACCGVLAVLTTYHLGRVLLSRPIALIGALLLAVSPYHIWYGQEAKMYALISFLAPLSLLIVIRAVRSEHRRLWLLWAALMAAFLYVHLFAVMMLLVAVIWTPLLHSFRRPRLSPALVVAGIAIIAAGLPVARWLIPAALTPVETGYYRYGLGEMIAILLRNFSMGLRPAGGPWPVLLFTLMLVLGCVPLVYQLRAQEVGGAWPPRRGVLLMLLYLVTPLLAIWLVSLRRPTFTDRYLIIVLPAFFLMIATGVVVAAQAIAAALGSERGAPQQAVVASLRRRRIAATRAGMHHDQAPTHASASAAPAHAADRRRCFAAALTVLLVGVCMPFVWAQTHNPYKADFRAATQYLTTQSAPDDLVLFVMPYVQRGFAYYHPQAVRTAEPPFTRDMSAVQVDTALRALVAGSKVVWLYLSEAEFWDERGQIAAWFERNATQRCRQEFAYIEVRCYEVR